MCYKRQLHRCKMYQSNMRSIIFFGFAAACAVASGAYLSKDVKYADSEFLVKQKAVLELLQHIHQNEVLTELYDLSKASNYEYVKEHSEYPQYVQELYEMKKHGMLLPMNEIFSIMHEEHQHEAEILFKNFYYAKDWDTFYKIATWARFHVNEGVFIYAFTVAVLHRQDTVGIVLPAPYEVYPFYFFNSEVIQKAQSYKMQGFYGMKIVDDTYTFTIPSNYTGSYVHTNQEQKLSYFTEDIGLNSYYYYFHTDYPFWMGGAEYKLAKDRRGEFYFYQYQQFLARYYLERLSNGLGHIPTLSFYKNGYSGYYPDLRYYNGHYFPSRDNHYDVYEENNYYYIQKVYDYEFRIREAIDSGFVVLPDGSHLDLKKPESIEILGNLFHSNPDSVNHQYYGYLEIFAKIALGGSIEHVDEHKVIPSVLEHFETAMRDPVFYQLYKRFVNYYYQFKDHLPSYKYEEIYFRGVKIESVEVDKLVTYFDKFDADITNAVDVEEIHDKTHVTPFQKFGRISQYHGKDMFIKVRQSRLNHLPFTVKLHVNSEKAQKAIVKIFIGPKYDEYGHVYSINENRENFYELDHFFVDLTVGKNDVVRNSQEFSWFVKDRTTYYELYKQVMLAVTGDVKFPLDMTEAHCGFPMRLMLPKGKTGGMPFQFFFMVMPYHEPSVERFTGYDHTVSCGVGSGARYLDTLPFGFPFDRKIQKHNWYTPNMYYHDVHIYHKRETDINAAH